MPTRRRGTPGKISEARAALTAAICGEPWLVEPQGLARLQASIDAGQRPPRPEASAPTLRIAGGTAYLSIVGMIRPTTDAIVRWYGGTSLQQLRQDLRQALGDPSVSRIVLQVNSYGGSAFGVEEACREIEAARAKKPVVAQVVGECYSAAYYLACAASQIVATPSSSVGSIGTIVVLAEYANMLAEMGITVNVITHGPRKGDGNPYQHLPPEGRASLQSWVDSYGRQFDAAVARNRGVSEERVRQDFGGGSIFHASDARRIGLIDGIGESPDDFVEADDSAESEGDVPTDQGSTRLGGTATQPVTGPASLGVFTMKISAKVRLLAYAYGVLAVADENAALQASDESVEAALRGYFVGVGATMPDNETEIVAALKRHATTPAQTAPPVQQQASQQQQGQATVDPTAVTAAERQRCQSLQAAGPQLGATPEQIRAAIDQGTSVEAAVRAWTVEASNRDQEQLGGLSAAGGGRIQPVESGTDAFVQAATEGFLERCHLRGVNAPALSQGGREMSRRPLLSIARRSLQMAGARVTEDDAPEEIARQALQMGERGIVPLAASGAWNRPSDFPNLLGGVVNHMLDQAIQLAEPTYQLWTRRLSDLPDFRPRTIAGVGQFDELDVIDDDEEVKQLKLAEEYVNWIKAGRFGNLVKLTPVMIVNDDLDGFAQQILSLGMAHERTINGLCVALLAGNVTLPDGTAMFTADGNNDITTGAAGPSETSLASMRLKLRGQTGVDGVGKLRSTMRIALVPSYWETAAEQLLNPYGVVPVQTSTINVFRGKITPVVEPELDDSDDKRWFGLCDPMVRAVIAHAFQSGYGPGGQRTTWVEPNPSARCFQLEGRFAACAVGRRGVVRNAGD